MNTIHVPLLTPVANVCDQILREIPRQSEHFSVAHVLMNPNNSSLRHKHLKMTEVYIILKGYGRLETNDGEYIRHYAVYPGSVFTIYPEIWHRLHNLGLTTLEHLVVASPPFDPKDIVLHPDQSSWKGNPVSIPLPTAIESIDGAEVIAYEDKWLDMSIAFGRVINGRKKEPHHHKKSTEWVYVIEGNGSIEKHAEHGGYASIIPGSWTQLNPGDKHALVNDRAQDMIAACICHPRFDMKDVYWN